MIARLVTAFAGSFLLAYAAYRLEAQAILARLGTAVATVMLAHGVTDGAARWTDADGRLVRHATLSGTADPATRRRVTAAVRALPGVAGADWPP